MPPRLEFSLLGPLLVRGGGAVIPVSVGRQRALLVALLLNSGRIMTVEELIDVLWGATPPTSATATLYNYVKRLRQALGDSDHSRIRTAPRGYAIVLGSGELDLHRFERLLRNARAALGAGAWDDAAAQARAGLSLWRGEPLADTGSETLARQELPRLTEMRLQALEVRLEAELRLGRHAEAVPELRQLVRAHPLREQWHALLMTALYTSDRQAEALAVYRDLHQLLAVELGVGPSTRLRELHRWILNGNHAGAAHADHARPSLVVFHAADQRQGRYRRALDRYRQSLAVFREVGAVSGQAVALNGVGEALLAAGQPFDACARHADALAVAEQICNRYEQARAHDGLGRAWQALGQPDRARAHWQQALDLYSWLGVPEADQVRILLREGA